MQKLQTKLHIQQADLPTQLGFLEVITRRGSNHFHEEKNLCKSLQAGTEGEQKLLQYLNAFGMPQWVVLQNVWFNHFRTFECDMLLITRHCLYIFEVKNYRGTFSYKDGKCYFNHEESPLNPFEQVRANAVSIRSILKRLNINLPVKAAVIFTGPDNEVHIHSKIEEIEAVQSTGIRNFILRIIEKENQHSHHSISPLRLIEKLEEVETVNPFMPQPLSEPDLREIKGGLSCEHCLSLDYKRSKTKIQCLCGREERIERAVLRAICDYSILQYNRSVSRTELMTFLEGEVALSYLRKILSKYFEHKIISGNAFYQISLRTVNF